MKKHLFFILLAFIGFNAQAVTYTFTHTSTNYAELTGDTKLSGNAGWTDFNYTVNLPFTFTFYGQNFNYVVVDNYGDVFFNNSMNYDFIAFGSIMLDRDTVNSASPISYKIEGSAGSRIAKIQYKNCGFLFAEQPAYVNFQIWLFEGTNVCELHMGPNNVPSTSNAYAGGLGPQIGVYKTAAPKTVLCLDNDASNPTPTTATNIDYFLTGTPPDGMVYTFSPAVSGVNDLNYDIAIQAYPNPCTNYVTLNAEEVIQIAEIYNLLGVQLAVQTVNAKTTVLDIAPLPVGSYLVKLSGKNFTATRSLVKE